MTSLDSEANEQTWEVGQHLYETSNVDEPHGIEVYAQDGGRGLHGVIAFEELDRHVSRAGLAIPRTIIGPTAVDSMSLNVDPDRVRHHVPDTPPGLHPLPDIR